MNCNRDFDNISFGIFFGLIMSLCGFIASPAASAVISANSTTLRSAFAAAQDGDTIKLSGIITKQTLSNRSFANGITIDATEASFGGTFALSGVGGVTITGGLFGYLPGEWQNGTTVRVSNSNRVTLLEPIVTGAGFGKEMGINVVESQDVTISNGRFSGLRRGIGLIGVTNGSLSGNNFIGNTSDGINISNSRFVTASRNICRDSAPSEGAHPDCIQLWSSVGLPMQSDISLLYNEAYGQTQGFTSFDPTTASGIRISMIGNRVDTSMPQGIACYGCFDSIITDNVLTTQPGARWRTFLRTPGGANNIVENNSIGPLPTSVDGLFGGNEPFDGFVAIGSRSSGAAWARPLGGAVPEAAVWVQLLFGFGCTGILLRQRLRQRHAMRGAGSCPA
jgi:hypothetical protein